MSHETIALLTRFRYGETVTADLRLGRWQDVLADVACDALVFDAPYSEKTHAARTERNDGYETDGLAPSYDAMTPADVREFCEHWQRRCHGWWVSLTDFALASVWRDEMQRVGRYAFVPVPCVMRGMSVRMQQDGPSSWCVYAVVSRPRNREFATWGVLPGAYTGGLNNMGPDPRGGGRGKPAWLMNALVRDYSKPGDLVCDPFAGWGSTLAAAVANGRRAIGAEQDPAAHAEALRLLARPQQLTMEVA